MRPALRHGLALASSLLGAVALAEGDIQVAVDPAEVAVGGVAVVRVADSDAHGSFGDRHLRFFPSGNDSVALVGIDLNHRPGRYPLRIETRDGSVVHHHLEVRAQEFPVERLTVPKKYTELDAKTLERVRRDQRTLEALWSRSGDDRYWHGEFIVPAQGPAGSPFGLRRFFNGEPRSPHAGIDFKAPAGAPVYASNRGRVALTDDLFFTGQTVVIDHGLGLFTLYVHLSEIGVRRDHMVAKSEEIGKVGATGRVTGPHLHFAMRVGEARVDPAALLGRVLD